jgi:hypothetical protein
VATRLLRSPLESLRGPEQVRSAALDGVRRSHAPILLVRAESDEWYLAAKFEEEFQRVVADLRRVGRAPRRCRR